ncbi:BamA/TamA family outer membrane protein [Novosphingobium sp. KCTC 2891]|uniref:autotransporter assembly complex protein TamA n=1 Tax=Novosphingobium sp. KCTC 2891 TaxID=2989730 RepID=UPI002222BB9C|nr:BamA/TamA family outer membrane protein [Novosphingobium sp. KCTC 2891]MCW1381245.1 BamA/TamA family outer membrane protein [Novosphingobium sp. KCTC 2891]
MLLVPVGAAAQSRDADKELEDLIPDAAIDHPDAWALDTDAARTPVPDVSTLDSADTLAPMTAMPEMTIAWPDEAELPVIVPLTADPDIALAEEQAKQAGDLLDTAVPEGEGTAKTQIANASISKVGGQVELAFPPDAVFPERDAVVARFAGLSSLKALDGNNDNLAQLSRRAREDIDLLQHVLRVYGYYDAQVIQSLAGIERPAEGEVRRPIDGEKVMVRFDVIPGPLYKLATIDLGDIAQAADAAKLRTAFALNVGDPVNSDRIVEERTHLDTALGENGYAFAKVGSPSLAIDHEPRTGDLSIPVTTGGTYRFGQVTSSLPKYLSSGHIARIARFDRGDLYQRSLVDDLRQAVLATGLVSAVTIDTREAAPPASGQPGTVDVDVTLTKAPQRTIAGLVGYSSGEGFRLEASWEHRNFFPPEGMLRFRGVAGTREQLAGVTFRRNNFLGRDQVLTADLYAQTRDTDAYNARTASFIASFERQTTLIFQKPFVWSAGLEAVATSEIQDSVARAGGARTTYFVAALPLSAQFDGSDSLLDPKKGFRVGLRLSPELSVQDSVRSNYVKAQFDLSGYLPVNDRLVIAGRTRLGTIQGADIAAIAPSRRFYAGGGASVRGYAYQAVGPKDAAGSPSGGRSLSEFSLEARVKTGLVGGAVSLVPFIDAGAVGTGTTPGLSNLKVGAGIGVRYETNFGPIRIDLGTPLNPSKGDSRIGVYVALGQAF